MVSCGNNVKVIKLTGIGGTYTACMCQTKESGRKASSEERDHVGGLNRGNDKMDLMRSTAKECRFNRTASRWGPVAGSCQHGDEL